MICDATNIWADFRRSIKCDRLEKNQNTWDWQRNSCILKMLAKSLDMYTKRTVLFFEFRQFNRFWSCICVEFFDIEESEIMWAMWDVQNLDILPYKETQLPLSVWHRQKRHATWESFLFPRKKKYTTNKLVFQLRLLVDPLLCTVSMIFVNFHRLAQDSLPVQTFPYHPWDRYIYLHFTIFYH